MLATDQRGPPLQPFAPIDTTPRGFALVKLGHLAFNVADIQKVTAFYCDVLGFRGSSFSPQPPTISFESQNFWPQQHEAVWSTEDETKTTRCGAFAADRPACSELWHRETSTKFAKKALFSAACYARAGGLVWPAERLAWDHGGRSSAIQPTLPILARIPAAVRFVSHEPAIGSPAQWTLVSVSCPIGSSPAVRAGRALGP
jgi:catechol 2,3-dioxygenase-like lactoylglutathione lyase family enzyme